MEKIHHSLRKQGNAVITLFLVWFPVCFLTTFFNCSTFRVEMTFPSLKLPYLVLLCCSFYSSYGLENQLRRSDCCLSDSVSVCTLYLWFNPASLFHTKCWNTDLLRATSVMMHALYFSRAVMAVPKEMNGTPLALSEDCNQTMQEQN